MGLLSAAVLGAAVAWSAALVVSGRRIYFLSRTGQPFRVRRARRGEEERGIAQRSLLFAPRAAVVQSWYPNGWFYSPIAVGSVVAEFRRASWWSVRRAIAKSGVGWWRIVVGA